HPEDEDVLRGGPCRHPRRIGAGLLHLGRGEPGERRRGGRSGAGRRRPGRGGDQCRDLARAEPQGRAAGALCRGPRCGGARAAAPGRPDAAATPRDEVRRVSHGNRSDEHGESMEADRRLVNSQRMFDRMRRDGLDALVATAPENVTYTSGYWALSQWIRRGPQAYVLIPAQGRGEPCIVTSTGLTDLVADGEVWVDDVRRFGFFATHHEPDVPLDDVSARLQGILQSEDWKDPAVALVQAIKERGLEGGSIGIDEMGTTPAYWDRLVEALPTTRISRASEVFRHVRTIKTAEEIRRLREVAQITERSIDAALAQARPGATELDMARAFHHQSISDGAFPVLG